MRRSIHGLAPSLLVSLALAACGGDDPAGGGGGGGGGGGTAEGRYFPVVEGASWDYQVVDVATGTSAVKAQTVEAYEDIGGDVAGTMGFRMRTEKTNGYTLSWQEDTGTALIRHHEQSFDAAGAQKTDEWYTPGKLRLDESPDLLVVGASYTRSYSEDVTDPATGLTTTAAKTETWTVEALDEEVTVPAGTFTTLRIRRSNDGTGVQKTYWFAAGVGKVKEEGGTQTELLTGYAMP